MAAQLYDVFEFPVVRDHLVANTVLVTISTIAVVLRFISRYIRQSRIWWDDIFIVISLLSTYGMLAMHYHYARIGMRHHITDIPPANTILIFKMLVVYQVVYNTGLSLAKISYLFFYLRIFVSRGFRVAAWVCMGCVIAYWIGSMLQVFLICQPFAKNWDATLEGHCADKNVAFSTIGAFNLLTDVMIMVLPIKFIWKLQMSLTMKLGIMGIFGVGLFISAITIIRIKVLTVIDFTDLPYSMIWAAFWSVVEPALAITNACIPMVRPVLKAAFPTMFSSRVPYASTPGGQSASASSGSKGKVYKKRPDEGEFPLTQLDEPPKFVSAGGGEYEPSLNDRSQDGSSPQHLPRSVIGGGIKAWS